MSDETLQERIARLETKMEYLQETLPPSIQRIDDRLRKIEWIAALGIGALGLLQFILSKWG